MKAFPQKAPKDLNKPADNYTNPLERGMDLRDYFAARAMQAILHATLSDTVKNKDAMSAIPLIYQASYVVADAMMKARDGIELEDKKEQEAKPEEPQEEAKPAKKVSKKND